MTDGRNIIAVPASEEELRSLDVDPSLFFWDGCGKGIEVSEKQYEGSFDDFEGAEVF